MKKKEEKEKKHFSFTSKFKENRRSCKEDESNFKFSFLAFLFTFMYYFAKGDWYLASIIFLTATVVPLKDYFLLGIIVGFLAGNGYGNPKGLSFPRVLLACVSLLAFALLKYTTLYWLGIA